MVSRTLQFMIVIRKEVATCKYLPNINIMDKIEVGFLTQQLGRRKVLLFLTKTMSLY